MRFVSCGTERKHASALREALGGIGRQDRHAAYLRRIGTGPKKLHLMSEESRCLREAQT